MGRDYRERYFPDDLLEAVEQSHEEYAVPSTGQVVFIVIHEGMTNAEESEFTIERVFNRLDLANHKVLEFFRDYYSASYKKADFYARDTFQGIGENSVGWYTSRNGTLALELHANEGSTYRIYAEEHDVEGP